jgi:hypothetical protein
MSKIILLFVFSIITSCSNQNLKKEPSNSSNEKMTQLEVKDCWKEFKVSEANISVKFCGEVKKDVLDDTLNGKKIKRNSYLVFDSKENGNARYFLGWFDWNLKDEKQSTLTNFYNDYSKDIMSKGGGSVKDSNELKLNNIVGRETTFSANDSNSLTIRLFYLSGKVVYVAFFPDETINDKTLQENSRKIFFDSFQILEN